MSSIAPQFDQNLKIVIIGSPGSGKSSLLQRYKQNKFNEDYATTIGVDLEVKTMTINNQKDTAGQDRFNTITTSYYRGANCMPIVFDITNKKSFDDVLNRWLKSVKEYAPPDCELYLVGNKSDLADSRKVTTKEAEILANSNNMNYIETSAKNGENVEKMFTDCIKARIEQAPKVLLGEKKSALDINGADVSQRSGCCS